MKIYNPAVINEPPNATFRAVVEHSGKKEYLWYSIPDEYAEWISPGSMDAFVTGSLLLAMRNKEDIYVEGTMSERLYYNLINYYMPIVSISIPYLSPVKIYPQKLAATDHNSTKNGIGTGFSSGIDSFCVLEDHYFNSVPESYKITHLIFNNVGSHHKEANNELFKERFSKNLAAVKELGLPYITIDSNLSEVLRFDFQLTATLRNLSAILVLQKLISKYYYASAYKYEDCFVGYSHAMAFYDPLSVHLLSTESTEFISSGCQYSRVEKTQRVSEIPLSYKYLNICIKTAGNCSVCWKCARTLLTLDILGSLEKYNNVFDLNKYEKIKIKFITKVLLSTDPLLKEIVQLAKDSKYKFPILSKFYFVICYILGFKVLALIYDKLKEPIPHHIRSDIKRLIRKKLKWFY